MKEGAEGRVRRWRMWARLEGVREVNHSGSPWSRDRVLIFMANSARGESLCGEEGRGSDVDGGSVCVVGQECMRMLA